MSTPTEYTITARAGTGDPAVVDTGTTVLEVDATWGGKPPLPGSAQLLAAAFATCLLKNLARTQDLMAFDYDGAEVEVVGTDYNTLVAVCDVHGDLVAVPTARIQRRDRR